MRRLACRLRLRPRAGEAAVARRRSALTAAAAIWRFTVAVTPWAAGAQHAERSHRYLPHDARGCARSADKAASLAAARLTFSPPVASGIWLAGPAADGGALLLSVSLVSHTTLLGTGAI
jgi:hypothetical protein